MSYNLERNYQLPLLTDADALRFEVDGQRAALQALTDQMSLEAELAIAVEQARREAILSSDALRLAFGINDGVIRQPIEDDTDEDPSTNKGLTGVGNTLPDGFLQTIIRKVRIDTHPDITTNVATTQKVVEALKLAQTNPVLSMGKAIMAAPAANVQDIQALRDERYRLAIVLSAMSPIHDTESAAVEYANMEVEGAEWRVRTIAAVKSFELLTGGDDVWSDFIRDIVAARNMTLISLVNKMQPVLCSMIERFMKGDPVYLTPEVTDDIDIVLHRIWSTLPTMESEGTRHEYAPPYQNWLEILYGAMQKLDVAEKPGETYTNFEHPIQVSYYGTADRDADELPQYQRGFADDRIYREYKDRHQNSTHTKQYFKDECEDSFSSIYKKSNDDYYYY